MRGRERESGQKREAENEGRKNSIVCSVAVVLFFVLLFLSSLAKCFSVLFDASRLEILSCCCFSDRKGRQEEEKREGTKSQNPRTKKEKKESVVAAGNERKEIIQSILTCDPSVASSVLLICAFTSSGRFIHCAARTACCREWGGVESGER